MKYALVILSLAALGLTGGCSGKEVSPPLYEEEGYVTIEGARLFYKIMGEGTPIVVIHGGPTLDHRYLLPGLGRLARQHRLIFYDQRLSGRSDVRVDSSTVSFEGFVADIEGIRRHFGLERMHLLGHSWGGLLAQLYATKYPERLHALILLNPMAPAYELWQQEEALLARRFTPRDSQLRAAIMQSDAFRHGRPQAYEQLMRLSFRHQLARPELADSLQLVLPDDIRQRSLRFQPMASDLTGFDLRDDLGNVHCPVLVVYGDREPATDIAAPAFRRALPQARVVVIKNCGHFPYLEQPAALEEVVGRFVAGN